MSTISLSRPHAARRPVRLLAGWALLALAVLLGAAGAAVAFFGAAYLTSSVVGLCLAALLACLVLSGGLAAAAAGILAPSHRIRLALGVAICTTLLVALLAALTIFRPLAAAQATAPLPAGAGYWDLPTGSRIAYRKVPAVGPPKPTPIIRLHGGPGAYAVAQRRFDALYQQLAQDGYDVYLYDQIGGGLSARLPDPRDYTVSRHIADLEALRRQIGAEQVIVLADSWGATLAANYMAVYPSHVARAIFTSPAPISYAEWADMGSITQRLPATQQARIASLFSQPRYTAVMTLVQINLRAAHAFAPDAEMDGFFDALTAPMMTGMVCDPAHFPDADAVQGFGFWANMMTGYDAAMRDDNRRPLLAANQTPVLVLTGDCNYIKPAVAQQYAATFPSVTMIDFPDAGHVIYLEQPDRYAAVVRAFLADQPLPSKIWR